MTIYIVYGDGTGQIAPHHPFSPVYEKFRDVCQSREGELTVMQVMECVVTLAITASLNMKATFDSGGKPLTMDEIAQSICFQIMCGVKEASDAVGAGATKQ